MPPSPKTRNSEVLASFVAYCEQAPQLRFWQALRNWSEHNFILVSKIPPSSWLAEDATAFREQCQDTFNWEGRDG